jgi:hypothetical protein
MSLDGLEHVLIDHIAAGGAEPAAFCLLLDIRYKREFPVKTGHVTEHLPGLDLPGMHEECIGDLRRTDFHALKSGESSRMIIGNPDRFDMDVCFSLSEKGDRLSQPGTLCPDVQGGTLLV